MSGAIYTTWRDKHDDLESFAEQAWGAPGSPAIDRGQPLTRTTAAGTGRTVPVEDVSCLSAGLSTSAGEVLIPGDEVIIAGARARVVALDRGAPGVVLDRNLRWGLGDPVTYPYRGAGPDVGAFESE